MLIELNTDFCAENRLTPTQYTILVLILEDDTKALKKFVEVGIIPDLQAAIMELKSRSLVDIEEDGTLKVTEEFLRTFKGKGRFEEFYSLFPTSVIRQDGVRDQLRTAKARCKLMYNRKIKSKAQHDHIIKCLKFELKERAKNNGMGYMKRMPNWIRDEQWKDWEDRVKADSIIASIDTEYEAYGTEVL